VRSENGEEVEDGKRRRREINVESCGAVKIVFPRWYVRSFFEKAQANGKKNLGHGAIFSFTERRKLAAKYRNLAVRVVQSTFCSHKTRQGVSG
jgi:hypothetical protein